MATLDIRTLLPPSRRESTVSPSYSPRDYFLNPKDGALRSLGFINKTGLEESSNHINVGSQILLRLVGANFLRLALGHFLLKNEAGKRRFVRLKIAMSRTILVLTLSKILFVGPPAGLLGRQFVGFLAASSLFQILGLGTMLYALKPIKTTNTEDRAPPAFVVSLVLFFLCCFFFGFMLPVKPEIFYPGGTMTYDVNIEEEGDVMNEFVESASRLQGACILAYLVVIMETIVDPTLHNVRKCCQLKGAIVCALYTFGFFFGDFDTSWHTIKNMYIMSHCLAVDL
jgi:hypothetical protein